MKASRGSRWAAALGVLGVLGFAQAASAQEKAADCFTHEAWFDDGPGGHGSSNGVTVTLNPFNPAWEQDLWTSLTVYGTAGDYTVEFPTAGGYAARGELEGWKVCKGYQTLIPATTTTVTATTVPVATTAPAVPTTPAPVVPGQPTTTTAPTVPPEIGLNRALPETGRDTNLLIAAGLFAVFSGMGLLIWRRMTSVN